VEKRIQFVNYFAYKILVNLSPKENRAKIRSPENSPGINYSASDFPLTNKKTNHKRKLTRREFPSKLHTTYLIQTTEHFIFHDGNELFIAKVVVLCINKQ